MSIVTLKVEGMSCNHCVMSVKDSVGALEGVHDVQVSLEDKKVDVAYDEDKTSRDEIARVVEDIGFEVVE